MYLWKWNIFSKYYGWFSDYLMIQRLSNLNEKKVKCKTQTFYVLHAFLLIIITLLIAVCIYCYLIKYPAKLLLPFMTQVLHWYYKLKMSVKDISIKSHTYYFFDDIISSRDFDPNNAKTDENSYKNILIYYNGYAAIRKTLKPYV